ncbi:hypothetical protein ABMA28_000373 [Loxostege sticticalis]|uniref:PiggyBac transposable element-derived protein domain-containing protein n=1 Tax=Loxostege sticticalis TaxID=481309 RepID=A0ABD0TS18_LOXSC
MRTRNLVGSHQWEVGHPLNEIWTTDADVPPELSLLAREVVSRRQRRANYDEDEFFDANDGSDSLLEGQDATFEWSPMDSFRGEEESFKPERTGSMLPFASAYDAFRAYWDDDILSLIVTETNQYAIKIVRIRALHFVNLDPALNDINPFIIVAEISLDRLHHLRPIISHLNSKFQSNYVLNKDICIDESLTLWKGRLNIKQYIRSKASMFGIKTFSFVKVLLAILVFHCLYGEKGYTRHPPFAPSHWFLLHKRHRLFMDNWYNSPLLARFLKLNSTDCVDVPALVNQATLKRGELIARHSGDVTVLAWQDKKNIIMISTCHGSSTASPRVASKPMSRPVPHKPQVVLDYNKFMGGVDLKDQMLEPYLLERKRCSK